MSAQDMWQSMAMYISAESIDAIESEQERAAAQLFQKTFSRDGKIITPSQISKIKYPDFDCLWIHIDRESIGAGVASLPEAFRSEEFIQAIRRFHQDGGNLYLSKFAVQLLFSDGIERVNDIFRPNIFSDGQDVEKEDIWSINPEIGARMLSPAFNTPEQYYDHRGHAIYNGLASMESTKWTKVLDPVYNRYVYNVYPMQGRSDFSKIKREDHNCMWRLANKETENLKIGLYIGDNNKFDIDNIAYPQEKAAIKFAQTFQANVELITKDDLVRIDPNNFDCIWIHIDRNNLQKEGKLCLPEAFRSTEFIEKIKSYAEAGGNLYLSKYATQLVTLIGRMEEKYAPNIIGLGEGGKGSDIWDLTAQVNYNWRESDPEIFHDRRFHDIYLGMTSRDVDGRSVFPILGPADGEIWREDHNCMWDLNALGYGEGNKVEQFRQQHTLRVLGQWGHVTDDAVAAIVEFRPTSFFHGRIIANGLAAYEICPREGVNAYQENVELFTKNILKYLSKSSDFKFTSQHPNNILRFEDDTRSTVLGTWAQDWDHQAAAIVEFKPASAVTYADNNSADNLNSDKAPAGTVIANGIACVQLYHKDNNNDYQGNADKLTTNIIDYLSPWHRTLTGIEIENVTSGREAIVQGANSGINYTNLPVGCEMEVFTPDCRMVCSFIATSEGFHPLSVKGPIVVIACGQAHKIIIR